MIISDMILMLSLYQFYQLHIFKAMLSKILRSSTKFCRKRYFQFQVQQKRHLRYNFSMQDTGKHKLGVAIDIDGTITMNGKTLPGAKEALQKLISLNIPYLLLTNNLSRSQGHKVTEVNNILNLSKPIEEHQIILSYTPIKQKLFNFGDGIVLLVGRQAYLNALLPLPFIKNYMTVVEYISLFPETVPLINRSELKDINLLKEELKERLGLTTFDKHTLQIAGILLLMVPHRWEENYQVIIDLLSTNNGTVSRQKSFKYVQDHIPVMAAFNDFWHVTHNHNLPRLLMKPFTEGLKVIYKAAYHHDLRIQTYGKPQLYVYQFAKKHLEESYGPIEKMVMIGDNEGTDIIGAYESSWDSILVKTGVTKQDSQFATVNAQNILQGLEEYLKQQNS